MTPADPNPSPTPAPQRRWERIWSAGQFVVALVVTLGVLGYLLRTPASKPDSTDERTTATVEPVQVLGPGRIRVDPASPINGKLQTAEVRLVPITTPILTVTGTVATDDTPSHNKSPAPVPIQMRSRESTISALIV